MPVMAFRITGTVYSTVCSDWQQRNINGRRYYALWGESIGDRWIPTQRDSKRGSGSFDDIIMSITSLRHYASVYWVITGSGDRLSPT